MAGGELAGVFPETPDCTIRPPTKKKKNRRRKPGGPNVVVFISNRQDKNDMKVKIERDANRSRMMNLKKVVDEFKELSV